MLNALTITVAHEKLKTKEIRSQDLVQACIDRIEKIDESLNAVVHRNFDRALEEAKKIDAKGSFSHPLTGIPYLAKDVYCEEGVPTTACSNILRNPTSPDGLRGAAKDYIPPFDCTTTKRLKAAGAISLGKTNTDEFTMGSSTETSCFGVTHNPWDTTRVAGGSSGGSAAAVSADEAFFALGTDTGSSIRLPAAFCSCVGLKVTYGRTSRFGVMSMASSLDSIGPLCKTVEDTALVLQVIAGHDPLDATTATVPVPDYRDALTNDLKGITIGLPDEYCTDGMHPDVEKAVRDSIKTLESLGAKTKRISLPHTQAALATYYVLCPCEVSSNMSRYDGIRYGHTVKDVPDLVAYYHSVRSRGFGAEVKRRIMLGTFALSAGYFDAYYRQAQKVRTLVIKDFAEAFKTVDAIATPVSPNLPFTIGAHENDPVAMYLEDVFMTPANLAGITGISVPCGFAKAKPSAVAPDGTKADGLLLPIGLQIMGPQWGEETVLRVAHAFEQATEWHTRKPELA